MFANCSNLSSFISDLSNLYTGECMFYSCISLTSFNSNISSLTTGWDMFGDCKLDAQSVSNIVQSLTIFPDDGTYDLGITIGIGCDDTEEDQLLFAQECGCETWQELLDDFSAKNWIVDFQFNGRPEEAVTYRMRRGATLPVYTKL
jgi:hypothetical protein